jgi:DNA polymerase I
LMRLFANMSLQTYAFDAKYKLSGRTVGLDEVGKGLVNQGKVDHELPIGKMTYAQLAEYSFGDADLTLKLTTFGNDTVMKLMTVLSRITYQPMEEDVSRGGTSNLIKSLMFREHRVRGWIIPRCERNEEDGTIIGGDILATKNIIDTKSETEGKKFRGAMVIEPVVGLHFGVSVLDFASLYPSIIETWNLGYETIRCVHKDCETVNPRIVPYTTHWVCKKQRAMTAEIIGSLKDIRVQWYKPKGKTNDYYKVVEQTIKVFMNATYGVFASDKFPLYCPPMGESVTQVGRNLIQRVIEKAKELGLEVFYGDTDSIFIHDPEEKK